MEVKDVKKNQDYIVKIEDLSVEGEGIGKICEGGESGFPLFVKDTVIGDIAKVRAIKVKKGYGYGRLMEILTPSPNRVKPPCPVARRCGGCTLQCMTYEEQLEFKRRKVENNLRRIGGQKDIEVPMTLGMKEPWRYRNKASYPVRARGKKGSVGFYKQQSHEIVPIRRCPVIGDRANKLYAVLSEPINKWTSLRARIRCDFIHKQAHVHVGKF